MSRHIDHLLIGGGVASATCAQALRKAGAEGSILLVGREPDPPYHRPPATKEYLRGEEEKSAAFVKPAEWYEEQGIELRTRTMVRGLDLEARTASLMGGDEIEFGTALVATGANVRRLRADGDDLEGLHYVRALGNADAIRSDAEEAERAVVVGGSYIGCEVAASLTTMGKHVTVLMQEEQPMERGFGADVGRWVRRLLEGRGIEFVHADGLAAFRGEDERVSAVVTEAGVEIPGELVVLGTGVTPDLTLARSAGLELGESGIRCSARLETSAPGVYAAGDVCEYDSPVHGRMLRVEHEDHAMQQGRTVAANMAGEEREHRVVPYFWTDLADWGSLESVGPAAGWDREIVRGSLEDDEWCVLYLAGERLVAATVSGRGEDLAAAGRVIGAGGALGGDLERLADPDAEIEAG